MLKVIILAAVLALAMAQIPVKSGVPFRGASPFRTWMYYSIPASEATINYVQIVATVDSVRNITNIYQYSYYLCLISGPKYLIDDLGHPFLLCGTQRVAYIYEEYFPL